MIPGQLPTLRELDTAAELAAIEQDATHEGADVLDAHLDRVRAVLREHETAPPRGKLAASDAIPAGLERIDVPGTPYAVSRMDERGGPGVRILILRGVHVVARAWWNEIDREITASDAGPGAIPGAAYLAIERALASA
jgi:hypothetical protein